MKTQINIWNPNTGNTIVDLNTLRERICQRRLNALQPQVKKEVQRKNVTTCTTDKTLQQVAAHYPSFKIRQFHLQKAIEVFNDGGSQKATIINK